jgi:hypothetical protein
MLRSATITRPPITAKRPSVCMVVCISLIAPSGYGRPSSSSGGTASTVMASATTYWTT